MKLTTLIKERVRTILFKRSLQIISITNKSSLETFFTSIKPVSTNYRLIRIGGESDGGYLIPDDLEDIKICFSPGVSTVSDFESDMAKRGMTCFLADYSVEAPPLHNQSFHFEKKYLGQANNSVYMTFEKWVKRNAPQQKDFILQMDIEGSEYGVILDTDAEILRKFRILVVEFHKIDNLTSRLGFELINLTFEKLLKDFVVVHIHPNNYSKPIRYLEYLIPPIMEFTFLRKDRILSSHPTMHFPHPLDRKNVAEKDDVPLPMCWYG